MGAMMKGEKDLLTLQIQCSGPVQGLTVTADAFGHVKGYAVNPVVSLPARKDGKLDVGGALDLGVLTVIKDIGMKEPYSGQVAVGAVVLNRIRHPSFPNTLSGVIYQSGAFTCITDGQFNEPVAESAYRAARDALNGVDPSGGAIYYFNPSTATSAWIWSRPLITVIGKHRFCA